MIEIDGALHGFLRALHGFPRSLRRLRSLDPRFPLFHRYSASQPNLPSNLLRNRLFLLLLFSPAIAEFSVRVHVIHLPTPNPRLAPLPSLFFLFLFLLLHPLLKQLARGLEHSEASFVPTVHRFAHTHAVDFGGKRSVEDGKRRSATLLARTCSGFYVSPIPFPHLAVIAALRRVGFPLLPLTSLSALPTSSWKYCKIRLRRHAFSEQNCITAFNSSSCRSAPHSPSSPLPTRFSSSSRLIMNAIAFLRFSNPLSPTRLLDYNTPRNRTAVHRAPLARSPFIHRLAPPRLPDNNYTATAGDSSAPLTAHRSAPHPSLSLPLC